MNSERAKLGPSADLRVARVQTYLDMKGRPYDSVRTAADVLALEAEIAQLPAGTMPAAYIIRTPQPQTVAEKFYGATTPSKATS